MSIKPLKSRTVSDLADASFKIRATQDQTIKHNFEYGELIDYDPGSGRVRVRRIDGKVIQGKYQEELWFPLITPEYEIESVHSGIKCAKEGEEGTRGFLVRYHWTGSRGEIVNLVGVEILGDFPLDNNDKNKGLFRQERKELPEEGTDFPMIGS